jgi:hypothetical protein
VGPTAGQGAVVKRRFHYCPYRELNPGRSARSLVPVLAKPTQLLRSRRRWEINIKMYVKETTRRLWTSFIWLMVGS